MKEVNAYKTIRTEWKKSRKFYEKLEAIKKRASPPAAKKQIMNLYKSDLC